MSYIVDYEQCWQEYLKETLDFSRFCKNMRELVHAGALYKDNDNPAPPAESNFVEHWPDNGLRK